ncbi:hypothetical protein DFJ73DRAFT_494282 [Zopfochytrium polystomum]|nr:hypothetical protein DFJ73DRAFT_494282 [Zopfochytrium polystomum]
MSVGGTARQRTRTVFKSFTPAWNEVVCDQCFRPFSCTSLPNQSFAVDIPTGKKADKCFLDFFLCDRYGNQTSEVSARTTVQDRVFLRDQLYDDHEFHELRLPLKPQGTLIVQIRKEGEVQNIDYWVRRSEELLDSTAHKMVNTLVQRIADHTSYAWAVVLDKIASFSPPPTPPPTFSTIFFPQPPTTPPPQPTVESEALQILEYLDRNMSLLNEGLDRNLLNNFLRKLYPILGPPVPVPRQKVAHNAISAQEWDEMDSLLYSDGDSDNHSDLVSDASSPSETGSDSDVSEDPVLREMIQNQAKRELNAPSLLCRVVWMELASRMLRDVQVYARGGGPPTTASGPGESANFMNVPNGSGGRLVFAPRTTSVSAIDEDDVKQIEALDGILEMIKAFFFNEIAGRCNGFPLRILEDDVYRQAKALIANLCIRHEEALH